MSFTYSPFPYFLTPQATDMTAKLGHNGKGKGSVGKTNFAGVNYCNTAGGSAPDASVLLATATLERLKMHVVLARQL